MGLEERRFLYSSSGDIQIGTTLRKAREELGVTLDDVEDETKIRKRYLVALEREDYESLPSSMYARGFLKTYANYLGLDGESLSQELKSSWEGRRESQGHDSPPRREPIRERTRSGRVFGGTSRRRRRISLVAMIGFVFSIALLAAIAFGLYNVGQSSRTSQEPPKQQQTQNSEQGGRPENAGGATEESSTNTTPVPVQGANTTTPNVEPDAGRTEATPEATPSVEKISVKVMVAQVPAWLNVQTDGGVAYEQVAQPGFSQTFEAGEQIQIWTGNAGAVRLEVNGQDYGALGAPGEVKRRLFTLKPAET